MTDVIEYVRRSTLNMTDLNRANKRKDSSRLYRIVEDNLRSFMPIKKKDNSNPKIKLQFMLGSGQDL